MCTGRCSDSCSATSVSHGLCMHVGTWSDGDGGLTANAGCAAAWGDAGVLSVLNNAVLVRVLTRRVEEGLLLVLASIGLAIALASSTRVAGHWPTTGQRAGGLIQPSL